MLEDGRVGQRIPDRPLGRVDLQERGGDSQEGKDPLLRFGQGGSGPRVDDGVPAVHKLGYALGGKLGIEDADDAVAVGDVAVGAASLQVPVQIHKGIEPEALAGNAQDERMGFR